MSWRIGIDLGGTKVEGLLLDESGAERWRERVPTPQGDYDGTIEAIKTWSPAPVNARIPAQAIVW